MSDIKKRQYLRTVKRELADLSPGQRSVVLADLESHFDDATRDGVPTDFTISELGPARDLASAARSELLTSLPSAALAQRTANVTILMTVAVGLLTALLTAFMLPLWNIVDREEAGNATTVVIGQIGPAWGSLLGAIPSVIVLVALLLRPLPRRVLLIVLASAMTLLLALGATLLSWYLPFLALLWLSVFLPVAVARGFQWPASLVWRAGGVLVLVVPGFILLGREVSATNVIILIAAVGAASCWLLGLRFAGYPLLAVGVALMAFSIASPGTFMLGTWWVGGLFVLTGTIALATSSRSNTTGESE